MLNLEGTNGKSLGKRSSSPLGMTILCVTYIWILKAHLNYLKICRTYDLIFSRVILASWLPNLTCFLLRCIFLSDHFGKRGLFSLKLHNLTQLFSHLTNCLMRELLPHPWVAFSESNEAS